MFKDYQFFSINLQDAARQILEAQEAKAKQYLLEYDTNNKPMPGYTYVGQEPELRSDEDAEKTKEWYTNVVDARIGSGDMEGYQSEVDYEGRPTGRTSVKLLRVPTEKPTDRSKNKPKEEVEPEIITQKYEPDPEIQKLLHGIKYPSYDKNRKELPVPTEDDLAIARLEKLIQHPFGQWSNKVKKREYWNPSKPPTDKNSIYYKVYK